MKQDHVKGKEDDDMTGLPTALEPAPKRSTDLCECPATTAEQSIFVCHLQLLLVDISGGFEVVVESLISALLAIKDITRCVQENDRIEFL